MEKLSNSVIYYSSQNFKASVSNKKLSLFLLIFWLDSEVSAVSCFVSNVYFFILLYVVFDFVHVVVFVLIYVFMYSG